MHTKFFRMCEDARDGNLEKVATRISLDVLAKELGLAERDLRGLVEPS